MRFAPQLRELSHLCNSGVHLRRRFPITVGEIFFRLEIGDASNDLTETESTMHHTSPFLRQDSTLSLLVCLLWPGVASAVTCRYASSYRIIYVTGPGETTLTQNSRGGPLSSVDSGGSRGWGSGIWGPTSAWSRGLFLICMARSIGGDVSELRLQSNNVPVLMPFVSISAQWGTISIKSSRVLSWDDAVSRA